MIPEVINKESLEQFSKKLKGWKDNDRGSVSNIVKRLQTAKVPKDLVTVLDSVVSLVFKEMINSDTVEKSLLADMNKLKKKLKEAEKTSEIQKTSSTTSDSNNQTKADAPQELLQKVEGRRKDYLKFLYKAFMKNCKQDDFEATKVIKFVQQLEGDIYEVLQGDDSKILERMKEIRFNMEPPSSIDAKRLMLDGIIVIRQVTENKTKTYTSADKNRQASEVEKKMPVPNFEKGHGEQCEKCLEKEAYVTRMVQIRASDEPMTRFLRCRKCDHEWTDN